MSYVFTNNWFHFSEIKRLILYTLNKNDINTILEIGSHEGQSSCYFSDFLLDNPESSLVCVDPFDTTDPTTPVTNNTKELFLNNISKSKNFSKIKLEEAYSYDFYKNNKQKFNFIYIDGSHLLNDITIDFNNCLEIIKDNGIIWMDDYACNSEVKEHINNLYEKNKNNLCIIHYNYQVAFRKL